MSKKLYVSNLAFSISSDALHQQFAAYGTVQSAQLIVERDTGRSRGFAFVEMGSDTEAQAAIAGLHGQTVQGRVLNVDLARTNS